MCLGKPYEITVHQNILMCGRMMDSFLPFSYCSLVRVWFNSPHSWCMLSDLALGDERACKDLVVLDLCAGTLEAHTTVDTMEITLKLDVCTSEGQSTFWSACSTRSRWPCLYNQGTAVDVTGPRSKTSNPGLGSRWDSVNLMNTTGFVQSHID